MRTHHWMVAFLLLALGTLGLPVQAQSTSHILRGRVTTGEAPLAHARITVTDSATHLPRTTFSGDDGRYTILLQNGPGPYTLVVAAIGFTPVVQHVLFAPTDSQRVIDVAMAARILAQVTIVAQPSGHDRTKNTDRSVDSIAAAATTSLDEGTGDLLSSLASTMPGVTITPGANGEAPTFSVLGTPAAQNNMTLDGTRFTDGVIPPDALGAVHLATSPYDPALGNFSGGRLSVSTRAGTNVPVRTLRVTLAEPSLTFPDATTRAIAPPHSNLQFSGAAGGAIVPDHLFYFASIQSSQQTTDVPTLLDATATAFQHAGLAPDSAARALQVLTNNGIPATVPGLPNAAQTTTTSASLRLDLVRSATASTTLTFLGSQFGYAGVGLAPLATPTDALAFQRHTARVQLASSEAIGANMLQELHASVSRVNRAVLPALVEPNGSVLVGSTLSDGTPSVATLTFGGGDNQSTSTTTAYDMNEALSWRTRTHTVQLTADITHQHRSAVAIANNAGTFVYPSLDALATNTPSTFTRTLGETATANGTTTVSTSIGDTWHPTPALELQYGARLDAQWFSTVPRYNAALDSAFGIRNDVVPHPSGVSPRLGFTYQIGTPNLSSPAAGSQRPGPKSHTPAAFLSSTQITGGLGAFRGDLDPSLVATAAATTGLPGSAVALTCVGAAVPTTQWASYTAHPDEVPTQCADGSGASAFAAVQPTVTVLPPGLQPPTSWRASLGWQGTLARRWNLTFDGTYALGLHQFDPIDINLRDTPGFLLANEANRPVFTTVGAIVPATGAIAPGAAERDTTLGVVTSDAADLRSVTTQLTVTATPMAHTTWGSYSLAYTYTVARDQSRGFTSPNGGNPDTRTWVSGEAPHHVFLLNTVFNVSHHLDVTLVSHIYSPARFTPLVGGSVSGVPGVTDRAFIFPGTDPQLGQSMASLLTASSPNIRDCLRRQTGAVAVLNSCATPWTLGLVDYAALNLQPRWLRWSGYTTSTALQFVNPVSALDQLLNGALHSDRWDSGQNVDPTLLYVRGFDPASQSFLYTVNPRFGTANHLIAGVRPPFTVRLQLSVQYHPRAQTG